MTDELSVADPDGGTTVVFHWPAVDAALAVVHVLHGWGEHAQRYDRLTFDKVISDDLRVMDTAAIALARDNHLPIVVFDMHRDNALAEVLEGRGRFTVIATAAAA